MPPDGSPRRCWPFLNEAPKPRLRRCHPDCGGGVRCRPSMKLRSRDFGDATPSFASWTIAAPSMKLRSRDFGDWREQYHHVAAQPPSMKLRSRDFGDNGSMVRTVSCSLPSMKLRSRDFGDLYPYAMLCALDASPQ